MAGKKAKAKARKAAQPGAQAPAAMGDRDVFGDCDSFAGVGTAGYVELRAAPGKGLGMFAKRDIAAGTVFFEEHALMHIRKPMGTINERDVTIEYNKLPPKGKRTFNKMYNSHGPNCSCKSGLFFGNLFSGNWAKVSSCYPWASRFNHSCVPNATQSSVKKPDGHTHQTFKADRDIAEGEEITFCYVPSLRYMTSDERKERVKADDLFFTCACELCTADPSKILVSNMRRQIMRHLLFWMAGGNDLREVPPANILCKTDSYTYEPVLFAELFAALAEAEGVQKPAAMWWAMAGDHQTW